MLFAEMRLRPRTPRTYEIVVQRAPYRRTGKWNQASNPLFRDLGAGFNRDALDHPRDEAIDDFFLQQFAADVDSGSGGGCNPKFSNFFVAIQLETVDQAKFLNRPHGDGGKNAKVGQDGKNSAKPKPRALSRRQLHAGANY